MALGTKIFTMLFGRRVGEDAFGNVYWRCKKPGSKRERRWVIYNGIAEPSKVPAEWHMWLHYVTDTPPADDGTGGKRYFWQKSHLPNRTGTKFATFPKGHLYAGDARQASFGDYTSWDPVNTSKNPVKTADKTAKAK